MSDATLPTPQTPRGPFVQLIQIDVKSGLFRGRCLIARKFIKSVTQIKTEIGTNALMVLLTEGAMIPVADCPENWEALR